MEHNRPHARHLPRILVISSGKGGVNNSTLLHEQIKHLPPALPCMVQIREKHLSARALHALALAISSAKLPKGTLLLINERIDIALSAGLHGVHLPENAMPPDAIRAVSSEMLIGCSVHSPLSARRAEKADADYLLFGPVYDTPSKRPFGNPQGLEKLAELCAATALPVFAVGGITPQNAGPCVEAGAYGIAAISLFMNPETLSATIEQCYRTFCP